jgi:hypothetical protein
MTPPRSLTLRQAQGEAFCFFALIQSLSKDEGGEHNMRAAAES